MLHRSIIYFVLQLLTHTHTHTWTKATRAHEKRGCTAFKIISKGNWSKHNLFNVTAIKRLTRTTKHTTNSHKYTILQCTPAAHREICERVAKIQVRRRRRRNDNCRAKRSKIKWAPHKEPAMAKAAGEKERECERTPHTARKFGITYEDQFGESRIK